MVLSSFTGLSDFGESQMIIPGEYRQLGCYEHTIEKGRALLRAIVLAAFTLNDRYFRTLTTRTGTRILRLARYSLNPDESLNTR